MKFTELSLRGVWLIEPDLVSDERGVFRRTFCASEFSAHGLAPMAVQGNISENPYDGTLRGFHYQAPPFGEAKTLLCVSGSLFDVVVDLRPESATFMKWISLELSANDRRELHVPAGCANAWMTSSVNTTVLYYMSEAYQPNADRGIRYNDPGFSFRWPREPRVISKKDVSYPDFDSAALASR